MRKLSLIGLLSAAFMFPQIPLSVDYSLDFLNVLTLLNHPVSKHMFINATKHQKWYTLFATPLHIFLHQLTP